MIIDVRCRPPLEEFREYFDIPRITWHGRRTGAKDVSRAFCEGSMALYLEEMQKNVRYAKAVGDAPTGSLLRRAPPRTLLKGVEPYPAGLVIR